MVLKPLDLVVALELASRPDPHRTYAELAAAVGSSASEAHQATRRAIQAGLLRPGLNRNEKPKAKVGALLAFLEHGVRHAFFVAPGPVVRGVLTAYSAPPLNRLVQAGDEPPLVWPAADGTTRGRAIEPLTGGAGRAARVNPSLYELLALVDALRCGSVRDRKLAMKELASRFGPQEAEPES